MPKISRIALKARIQKLQKQLANMEADKEPAIKKVRALMKKLSLTVNDLIEAPAPRRRGRPRKNAVAANGASTAKTKTKRFKPRGKLPVKFRDSASGKEWSGRGKTPTWLVEAEKNGRSRESFRI